MLEIVPKRGPKRSYPSTLTPLGILAKAGQERHCEGRVAFANRCGLGGNVMQRIYAGVTVSPTSLRAIAKILGISNRTIFIAAYGRGEVPAQGPIVRDAMMKFLRQSDKTGVNPEVRRSIVFGREVRWSVLRRSAFTWRDRPASAAEVALAAYCGELPG